jgi:hypothetical protein
MGHGWSSWKNHTPTKAVQIEAAGKLWTGQWQVHDGDLVLASAYGCRRAKIGRQDRDKLAEKLMREILLDYAHGHRPTYDC